VKEDASNAGAAGYERKLRGVISAIPTPITAAGEPDLPRFVNLAHYLLANGCDGLNVLGTTGEATSLSLSQRMMLMSEAALQLPRERLMVGVGAAAVLDAIRLARHAAELSFAGALLLPPFYYKNVSDAGVIAYMSKVIESTAEWTLPFYLYHFPALSGVPFAPILVSTLVERFEGRVAGLKDSSGDLSYARTIAALSPRLDVFPSNEAALMEARTGTFAGCISASANLNSHYCARAYHAGDEDALGRAVAIRRIFDGLPLIAGIKLLLARRHDDPELARLLPPLSCLSADQEAELRKRQSSLVADLHSPPE
jgi:4-hydroxy-tetrahydrodipicolinate synthase